MEQIKIWALQAGPGASGPPAAPASCRLGCSAGEVRSRGAGVILAPPRSQDGAPTTRGKGKPDLREQKDPAAIRVYLISEQLWRKNSLIGTSVWAGISLPACLADNRWDRGSPSTGQLLFGNTGAKANLRCRARKSSRESNLTRQRLPGLEQSRGWCPPKNWLKHSVMPIQVTEMSLLGGFFALHPLPSTAGWVPSHQALLWWVPQVVMLLNYLLLLKPTARQNSPESYKQFITRFWCLL